MHSRLRIRLDLVSCAALALAVAACGGAGGTAPPTVTQPAGPLSGASASPSPSPSPASAATLSLTISGLSASVHSLAVTFNGANRVVVALPGNCAGSSSCTVNANTAAGANETVVVQSYASSDGSGSALAFYSTTASFFSGQTTFVQGTLVGIMATYQVSLNPSTFAQGFTRSITIGILAFDAGGAALSAPFVNTGGTYPSFNVTVTDANATTTNVGTITVTAGSTAPPTITYQYNGSSSSQTFTATTSGYSPVSASATITQGTPSAGYFVNTWLRLTTNSRYVVGYPTGSSTVVAQFLLSATNDLVRFDPSGNIWQGFYGATTAGAPLGHMTLNGTNVNGFMLGFDTSGNVYVERNPLASGSPALDVYAVNWSTYALTLARSISTSDNVCSVGIDAASHIYAAFAGSHTTSSPSTCAGTSVVEYPATGNGAVAPIATNATAAGAVTVDRQGNVYAKYGTAVGEWLSGTFGSGAPSTVLQIAEFGGSNGSHTYLDDISVDRSGNLYVIVDPFSDSGEAETNVYFYPPGTIAQPPALLSRSTAASVTTPF